MCYKSKNMKNRLLVLFAIGLSLVACSPSFNSDSHSSGYSTPIFSSQIRGSYSEYIKDVKELDNLTDDQLLNIYFSVQELPEQYINLLDYRIDFIINSSSSEESAKATAEERVHDERIPDMYDIPTGSDVVYQNDYYYIVHVTWDYYASGQKTSYEGHALSFKDTSVDFTAPAYHLDIEFAMTIKDLSKIQTIIDIYECVAISGKFIISEVKETEDKYIYNSYYFKTIYGDWGLDNEVELNKRTYETSKGGVVNYKGEETLKTVTYPGSFSNGVTL